MDSFNKSLAAALAEVVFFMFVFHFVVYGGLRDSIYEVLKRQKWYRRLAFNVKLSMILQWKCILIFTHFIGGMAFSLSYIFGWQWLPYHAMCFEIGDQFYDVYRMINNKWPWKGNFNKLTVPALIHHGFTLFAGIIGLMRRANTNHYFLAVSALALVSGSMLAGTIVHGYAGDKSHDLYKWEKFYITLLILSIQTVFRGFLLPLNTALFFMTDSMTDLNLSVPEKILATIGYASLVGYNFYDIMKSIRRANRIYLSLRNAGDKRAYEGYKYTVSRMMLSLNSFYNTLSYEAILLVYEGSLDAFMPPILPDEPLEDMVFDKIKDRRLHSYSSFLGSGNSK